MCISYDRKDDVKTYFVRAQSFAARTDFGANFGECSDQPTGVFMRPSPQTQSTSDIASRERRRLSWTRLLLSLYGAFTRPQPSSTLQLIGRQIQADRSGPRARWLP